MIEWWGDRHEGMSLETWHRCDQQTSHITHLHRHLDFRCRHVNPLSFHDKMISSNTTNMSESKNIIITGAGGMIGPMLAKRLLNDGHKLVLTDLVQPKVPEGVAHPENAKCMKGDICDPSFVKSLVEAAQPLDAIFIFHGIMSAGSEANFDLVSLESLSSA